MNNQKAFVFRQENCVGCEGCVTACQVGRGLSQGLAFRTVTEHQKVGPYNKNVAVFLSQACHHCSEPACVHVCPTGAMHKRKKDGIVAVDNNLCVECERCINACPYGAVTLDPETNLIVKCDMCKDRQDSGQTPYCVSGCPLQILSVASLDEALSIEGAKRSGYGYVNSTEANQVITNKRSG